MVGRPTRVTRPGSYIEYVYNARDWQTDVRNRTTGGTTRYDATYEYNDGALWDHTGNPLKRVENFGGNDYTTTLRYDDVYRETEETKRDSGNNVTYTLGYGYDQVGNRTSLSKDGTTYTFVYDDNNKMSSASGGGLSASFGYDGAGSMTSVTGTMYQNKTLVFDDESRMSSITYGGVTDTYAYNWQGLRTRAYLNGTYYRYLYHGERVLQDLTDAGGLLATYTTENDSYYGTLLHIQRATGESRFPLYDEIGSARGLVDANGTVTDTYELDTFGRSVSSSGTTPNPYRFGGAWGYITDPSGMLQLGVRFYWPEIGGFISQDPIGDGVNWYAYVGGNPVRWADPRGLDPDNWYWTTVGGAGEWVDSNLLFGVTGNSARVTGLHDAGQASDWEVAGAGIQWCGAVGVMSTLAGKAAVAAGGWTCAAARSGSVAEGVKRLTNGQIRLDLGRAAGPVTPDIMAQTGMPRGLAGRMHQARVKIPHVNVGRYHVIVNRYNWYMPHKWFVKGS